MSDSPSTEDWASAYVRAQSDPKLLEVESHPDWWAVERFMDVGDAVSPRESFDAILAILQRVQDERILGLLAAGPLEDMIEECGPEMIEAIEQEAARNELFRWLLGGVWKSSTADVWERVEQARGQSW